MSEMQVQTFVATYFDGQSSRAHEVQAQWDGQHLHIQGPEHHLVFKMGEWQLQPPLGKTRRMFNLQGGGRLITEDFQAIQALEVAKRINPGMRWVDAIERNWKWVLTGFVVLGVFLLGFFRLGLPVIAREAAEATPLPVLVSVGDQTLKLLQKQYLQPSKVPTKRQKKLTQEFQRMTSDIGENYPYQLHFYASSLLGANAFALPSGDIVITDDLIKLAQSDREILGVLAHEIAHVTQRHTMKSVYQGMGVFLVVSLAFGDFTSPTSLASTVPIVLIQNGYSRAFESEADRIAGQYMLQKWGTTKPLQDMLKRLVADAGTDRDLSLLQTHPGVQDRIQMLQKLKP